MFKPTRETLWQSLQAIVVFCALLAPVWFQRSSVKVAVDENEATKARAPASEPVARMSETSITSRIYTLPDPGFPGALIMSSESRQVRFQRIPPPEEQKPLRGPASLQKPAVWKLFAIRHKAPRGDTWQALPLVRNERGLALGTPYVELHAGENMFEVTFEGKKGVLESYSMKVQKL